MTKKKSKKKINPEKSNKMIVAVAGGLVFLVILYVIYFANRSKPPTMNTAIEKTEKYLKQNPGITKIKIDKEKGEMAVIFNSDVKDDYPSIARYAAKILSEGFPGKTVIVRLYKNNIDNLVLQINSNKGRIIPNGTEDK